MSFTITQPTFEGPIELLLSMIEESKLSISDVSLATVADQYLAHITAQHDYPIGSVTQFVWVASTLVLIKAKSLLPNLELTNEESADIADLEERLRKLAVIREFSKYIENSWGQNPVYTTPGQLSDIVAFLPDSHVTVPEIGRIGMEMMTMIRQQIEIEQAETPEISVPQTIRLEDIMARIRDSLSAGSKGSFKDITTGVTEKRSIIVTFLALLELARQAQASLVQSDIFGDIAFGPYSGHVDADFDAN